NADAVAAVDASRLGQGYVALGGDAGVEAPAGHRDGEGVLGVAAARLHALVTENALGVIADIQIVVDLDRLGDRLGRSVGRMVMACRPAVARLFLYRRWTVTLRLSSVVIRILLRVRRGREIDRRGQEFEHHLAGQADPR